MHATAPGEGEQRFADPELRALAREIGVEPGREEVLEALLRLGVSPEAVRRALEHGRIEDAIFEAVLDPARDERTVSSREIEAAGGLSTAEIGDVMRGFGLPAPGLDDPYFTPEEAHVLREIGRLGEIWTPEVRLQVSRVYGQALSQIAETETHMFRSRVERRVREISPTPAAGLAAVRQALERLLPLADPMLLGVHRRKVENELTAAAVHEIEQQVEGAVPGSVEVALLFCDLKDFTAYTEQRGDAAAVGAIERFAETVREHRGEGRLVKALGDGYMLAYAGPGEAVAAAKRLFAGMRAIEGLQLHASAHHGPAVYREGDYFGRSVNLAARLLTAAGPGELLATAGVAEATAGEHAWESRGYRRIRGFAEPIEVFASRQ